MVRALLAVFLFAVSALAQGVLLPGSTNIAVFSSGGSLVAATTGPTTPTGQAGDFKTTATDNLWGKAGDAKTLTQDGATNSYIVNVAGAPDGDKVVFFADVTWKGYGPGGGVVSSGTWQTF